MMSEKRFRYTFKFNQTHNIAQIYQDNVLICEDILIDEKTLDFLIDTLNGLSEQKRFCEEMAHNLKNENEQLRQEIVHLKDDLQYYKTKSARLEEELLSTRGCMYE